MKLVTYGLDCASCRWKRRVWFGLEGETREAFIFCLNILLIFPRIGLPIEALTTSKCSSCWRWQNLNLTKNPKRTQSDQMQPTTIAIHKTYYERGYAIVLKHEHIIMFKMVHLFNILTNPIKNFKSTKKSRVNFASLISFTKEKSSVSIFCIISLFLC